jgi:hypothetical protein
MPEKRRAVNVVAPVPICAVEREAGREREQQYQGKHATVFCSESSMQQAFWAPLAMLTHSKQKLD